MTDITQLIAKQLAESKTWQSLNTESMHQHRREGTLAEPLFNQQFLRYLSEYKAVFSSIDEPMMCGFEIEFYLETEKITELEVAIAALLPESQMLLIDLKRPIATNGRNFYLMAEHTGKPTVDMQSYEVVSPILDPKSLPYFLSVLLECLQKFNVKDDQHLGFHLHLSTLDPEPISPLALLYFLDTANCFDWPNRQFTRDLVAQFFDYHPQDWSLIFAEITRKCYNLNLLHYSENNHVELRSVGGKGYLQQTQKIIQGALAALQAMQNAKHCNLADVAEQIAMRYQLNKQVTSLSETCMNQLLTESGETLSNQLFLTTIQPKKPNQKNTLK